MAILSLINDFFKLESLKKVQVESNKQLHKTNI